MNDGGVFREAMEAAAEEIPDGRVKPDLDVEERKQDEGGGDGAHQSGLVGDSGSKGK